MKGDYDMAELDQDDREDLSDSEYAFPKERKEPLCDADHVRNAVARFNQVEGVSDSERDEAWKRIEKAAKKYDVELSEKSWHELRD
jgi:cell division protein FtsX